MSDGVLSENNQKICLSQTAFVIRCNSFALNCSTVLYKYLEMSNCDQYRDIGDQCRDIDYCSSIMAGAVT